MSALNFHNRLGPFKKRECYNQICIGDVLSFGWDVKLFVLHLRPGSGHALIVNKSFLFSKLTISVSLDLCIILQINKRVIGWLSSFIFYENHFV